jgi:hypothetical protein
MTVKDLAEQTGWSVLTGKTDRTISSAYVCDLLSRVMSHGREGTAWVTVQTHLNVVAIASLHEFSCVIIPEEISVSEETIDAANEKSVCMLSAKCTSYGAAKVLAGHGVCEV